MAERIIDVLEVIEVEKQQCNSAAFTMGKRDALFNAITQQSAVRQIRQRVAIGKMADALFEFLLRRNVGLQINVMGNFTLRVTDDGYSDQCRIVFAILAPAPDFSLPYAVTMQYLNAVFIELGIMPFGSE